MEIISYGFQSLGTDTMIMVSVQNEVGEVKVYASICNPMDDLETDIRRTADFGQRIDTSDIINVNLNNFISYEKKIN